MTLLSVKIPSLWIKLYVSYLNNTEKVVNGKEYDSIKQTEQALAFIKNNIIAKIPDQLRLFFSIKYCKGTEVFIETANALL